MTLRQRIRFYQQLAVLARAGVSLRASLRRLQARISGRQMAVLTEKVDAGERLGEAFMAAGFSPFECHLVTAGEQSAQLDAVFQHLSEFWARELEMRQALIRPLYYPVVVLHLTVLVATLVEFVATTETWPVILVHFVMRLVALYVVGFIVYVVARVSWSSDSMRRVWLWVPIIGSSLSAAYAYRWITALKLEFSAGITLSRAVGDAWRASGYVGCDRLAEEGEQAVLGGEDLSKLVLRWRQLPRDWIDFVETGEVSGSLDAAFKNLETEAARTWTLAQQRMAEWVPKIVYFVVLLIVAAVVGRLMYQVVVAPMVNAQDAVDNALK